MIDPDNSTNSDAIVPSPDRELTPRSANLIRRGLDDLSKPRITPELLHELAQSLSAGDFDSKVEAAHTVMRLAPHLSLEDAGVGHIVATLVKRLDYWFSAPGANTSYARTDRGPYRDVDLRDLFSIAFEALVGPETSFEDAILQVLSRSPGRSQEIAVNVLVTSYLPKDRARPVLQSALEQATGEWQALHLRFALAILFRENVDSVYRDLVQHYIASSAETGSGDVGIKFDLWGLERYVSTDTAAHCFCRLAAYGHADIAQDLLSDSGFSSVARSSSHDAWLRMTQIAWSQFLHARGKTHLAYLSPTRNPSEVRALLDQAPDEPYYLYPRGNPRRATSLKQTRWGRLLALLMDARIPREGPENL